MRQYNEPVEVRCGDAEENAGAAAKEPAQFLWHGRLWKVRAVLARWVETPPWWPGETDTSKAPAPLNGPGEVAAPDPGGDPGAVVLSDLECWRVEAGTRAGSGVFDLALDRRDGRWQLVGCTD